MNLRYFNYFRYTLQTSTFQMAVLLQFNDSETWTMQQLEEITQMKNELLLQVIQILLKTKLIVCDDDENSLTPSSVLTLFTAYKNKKLRFVETTYFNIYLMLTESSWN